MSAEADRTLKNVGRRLTLCHACTQPETSPFGVIVVAALGVVVVAAFRVVVVAALRVVIVAAFRVVIVATLGDPCSRELDLFVAPSLHIIRHGLLLCRAG